MATSATPPFIHAEAYDGQDYSYHRDITDSHTLLAPTPGERGDTPNHGPRPLHLSSGSIDREKSVTPTPRFMDPVPAHVTKTEKFISRTRFTFRIITFVAALAIVGILGHVLTVYSVTTNVTEPLDPSNPAAGSVSVWPTNLHLRPTQVLLGVAGLAAIVSLVMIVSSANAKVRHMSKLGNTLNLIFSTLGVAIWVAAVVYYKVWDTSKQNYDLLSWTCLKTDFDFDGVNFKTTCAEMRFTWYMGIALALFDFLNVVALFYWHFVGKKRAQRHAYMRT